MEDPEDNFAPLPPSNVAAEDAGPDLEVDGFKRVKTSLSKRYKAVESKVEVADGADPVFQAQMKANKLTQKLNQVMLVLHTVNYILCTWNEDDPVIKNNFYTQNHLAYNKLAIMIEIKTTIINLFCSQPKPNLGLLTHRYYVDLFIAIILAAIRISMFCYFVWFIVPDIFKLIGMTWTLNDRNWWKSPDEPFFASASLWNSLVCNIYWLRFTISIYCGLFLMGLLGIALIYLILRPDSVPNLLQKVKQGFYQGSMIILSFIYHQYVLGNPFMRYDLQLFPPFHPHRQAHYQSLDERTARENFLNSRRKAFEALGLGDTVECPICLLQFASGDDVVQLSCSRMHVYHTACLDDMMSRKSQNTQECGLCKGKIFY